MHLYKSTIYKTYKVIPKVGDMAGEKEGKTNVTFYLLNHYIISLLQDKENNPSLQLCTIMKMNEL